MQPRTRAFLCGLRALISSRRSQSRRRHSNTPGYGPVAAATEVSESRLMLVQPPLSVTAIVTSSQISVEWTPPSEDSVSRYDLTIFRTSTGSSNPLPVLQRSGIPAATSAGQPQTYTVTQPLSPGNYTVRLVAHGTDGTVSSPFSSAFTVTPLAPQLLTLSGQPLTSSVTTRPIVRGRTELSWTLLPGVNQYYVWISRKVGNTLTQIPDLEARSVQGGTFAIDLEPGGYRVWVRDLNRTPLLWSTPVDFDVTSGASLIPAWSSTPDAMSEGAMSEGAMSEGAALSWQAVPSAVRYDVELSGNAAVTAAVAEPEYRSRLLDPGVYTAKVRSVDISGRASAWSLPLTFTVSSSTYQPQLLTGPSGVQLNGVTSLTWRPVGWASGYDVTLRSAVGTVLSRDFTRSASFSFPMLAAGTYQAEIHVADGRPGSTITTMPSATTAAFQVTAATYAPGQPTFQQTPAGMTLAWPQLTNALSYDVWVDRAALNGFSRVSQLVRDFTFTTSFPMDQRFSDGATYRAWVRPRFADGRFGAWSPPCDFRILPAIAVTVTPGLDSTQPRLDWTELPTAISYRVRIIRAGVGGGGSETVVSDTPGLTRPWLQLAQPLSAGQYVARVDAVLPGNLIVSADSVQFLSTGPSELPGALNISVRQQPDGIMAEWDSLNELRFHVRVVQAASPGTEVLVETVPIAAGTSGRRSYLLRGGLAPGLYRLDVSRRSPATGFVVWTAGPVFFFNGNLLNPLQAQGGTQPISADPLTGPYRGDFDGDGDTDLVRRNLVDGSLRVTLNNSTSLTSSFWNAGTANGGGYVDFVSTASGAPILAGDFNGDGRADLVQADLQSSTWQVMRSSHSGSFEKLAMRVSGPVNPDLPAFAWDAATKSLSWQAIVMPNETALRTYELQIVRNGSSSSVPVIVRTIERTASTASGESLMTESLNDLTPGEYTVFCRTRLQRRESQWSEGFDVTVFSGASSAAAWQNFQVADFNGDRRDDIAAFNTIRRQWTVLISTGTSFERSVWAAGSEFTGVFSRHTVIDMNGDGRKDLVAKSHQTNEWLALIATGTSFMVQPWTSPAWLRASNIGAAPFAADIDADGAEDLFVWAGTSLRAAFSRSQGFQDTASDVTWQALSGMPVNSTPVDVNNDDRADLVGFTTAGKSLVSLSLPAGFTTPAVWEVSPTDPWFIRLQDSGAAVVDYDYRTSSVTDSFERVLNTVEFEAYRGLRKGPAGTMATQSGNAWDQAALLQQLIRENSVTKTQTATGRMTLSLDQLHDWLTFHASPFEFFQQAGLNPQITETGLLEIDHAWLQAWLPVANGMDWVPLDPSFKHLLTADPLMSAPSFTASDLNSFLNPVIDSHSADFDAGGQVTDHDPPTIPPQLQFQTGGAIPVSLPAWPKLGAVSDVKLQTSHDTPANLFVGKAAVNGELSVAVLALSDAQGTHQHVRIYGRATEDYEVGFDRVSGQPGAGPGQLYERHGNRFFPLTAVITTPTDSEVPAFTPVLSPGYFPIHTKLIVNGESVTVYVQWLENGSVQKRKLTAALTQTIAGKPTSWLNRGRFGIQTGGSAHHYLDNIEFTGRDTSSATPLSWFIRRSLQPGGAAGSSTDLSGIGQTRTIRQSSLSTQPRPVSLTATAVNSDWTPNDYQTLRIRFTDSVGNSIPTVRAVGTSGTPERMTELARSAVRIHTAADGRSAQLWINDVLYETATLPTGSTDRVRLSIETQVPGHPPEAGESFTLFAGTTAQLTLQVAQFSSDDLAAASAQLADAYDQIPVNAEGLPGSENHATSIQDLFLKYAAVRLLTSAATSQSDIGRLTDSQAVRRAVSAGLISASPNLIYQRDSVYFARPSNLQVDFPTGRVLYVPRNGAAVSQSEPAQQSRALLLMTELASRESELLSEVSDQQAISAATFLAHARLNGITIRRLKRLDNGTYADAWNPDHPASASLADFISFGTGEHRTAAFNEIQRQLNNGDIVTVSTGFRSVNGWAGLGWFRENYASVTPLTESLLLSDTDGALLRGGVLGGTAAQSSSAISLLPDAVIAPDSYRGTLRKSDTDFTLTIPGLTIPFTRTWNSQRSDFFSPARIVTDPDISGLGSGWSHPFAQQLQITSVTDSEVYFLKRKNILIRDWTGTPDFNNSNRRGEPTLIAWRRDDGSSGVFTPNGARTTDSSGKPLTADYDSPVDLPGMTIRRFDGPQVTGTPLIAYGDFYEVLFPDGAALRFRDFNPVTHRIDGNSTALLISISDRFGNRIDVQRDAADPSRITQLVDAVNQRVLARFRYQVSVTETRKGGFSSIEQQTITLPTGPARTPFVLSFEGQTTAALPVDATAAAVQEALRKLSTLNGPQVTVNGPAGGPYQVFFISDFALQDASPIGTLLREIEIPATATGAAPAAEFSGTRFWNYAYDAAGNLSSVSVSESTGSGSSLQLVDTKIRSAYTWYQGSQQNEATTRSDRLSRLMQSSTSFAGSTAASGTPFATRYFWYGNGRIREISDAEQGTTTFFYNAVENFTVIVDALSRQREEHFSDIGELQESVSSAGERTFYENDTQLRKISRSVNTAGRRENWEYDTKGNLTQHTDVSGISQSITYHPVFNQIVSIDEKSAAGSVRRILTNTWFETTAVGTPRGALATSVDALGNVTGFTYSARGLLAEKISPRGHSVRYDQQGYDVFGNPKLVGFRRFFNGVRTTQHFDETVLDNSGQPDYIRDHDVTNQRLRTTDYVYDSLGRVLSVRTPDSYQLGKTLQTQYTYGSSGLLETRTDPDGSVWRFEYDRMGRQTREIRPDGTATSIEYNADGREAARVDAIGNRTEFYYDVAGNLTQTVFPDGSVRATIYDGRGNPIREIDERGNEVSSTWSDEGRLLSTIDAAGFVTTYTYDEFGNVRTTETAVGITRYSYNSLRQLIQTVYLQKELRDSVTTVTPLRVDRFFFDANGNQDRRDTIDLRPDSTQMTPATIDRLTDETVTRTESDSVPVSRKRITSATFTFRDVPDSQTDAAGKVSRFTYTPDLMPATQTDARGSTTEYLYDHAGLQQVEAIPFAATTDREGLARVVRRDAMGRIVETRETAYARNTSRAVILSPNREPAVTAAGSGFSSRIARTVYDVHGRTVARQDALGLMTRITYDPAGNVVETIDESGRSTLSRRDRRGRIVQQVLPLVMVTEPSQWPSPSLVLSTPVITTTFDPAGNVISVTDAAGNSTDYEYDARNLLTRRTDPPARALESGESSPTEHVRPVWAWNYDALGHRVSETSPALYTATFQNDLFGRQILKSLPDPDGSGPLTNAVTTFVYDAFDNLIAERQHGDPLLASDDRVTTHDYNALNLRIRTTFPDPDGITGSSAESPVERWSYDDSGNLTSFTDPLNRTTSYTWDRRNLRIRIELPAVAVSPTQNARPTTQAVYDIFGNTLRTTDPLGRTTTYIHDAAGRIVQTVMPNPDLAVWSAQRSSIMTVTYDASGNVIRSTDHLGRTTTSAFDTRNRPLRRTQPDPDGLQPPSAGNAAETTDDALPPTQWFQYDINGNVAATIDAAGRTTRFEYDAQNRLTRIARYNGTSWDVSSTMYDRVGNVTQATDARGASTDSMYNGWNLLIHVSQPATLSGARPVTQYAYDMFRNQRIMADARGGETLSEFDALNRVVRRVLPDPGGRATRPETVFAYDAVGNLVREQVLVSRNADVSSDETWTETISTYDALNRRTSTSVRPERVPAGQVPTIQTLISQTYDLVGNIRSSTDAEGRVTTYEYDRLNRLVAQTLPRATTAAADLPPVTRYRYDLAGNLSTTLDPLGRMTTSVFDHLNRLVIETSTDPDGLQGPLPAPNTVYTYDSVGNVIRITDHLNRQTVTVYDAFNRPVSVTQPDPNPDDNLPAPTVTMAYDSVGNRIRQTDANGNVTHYEFDALNRLVATTLPDRLPNDRMGRSVNRVVYDLLGNIVQSIDAAGRITDHEYDALNRRVSEQMPDPDGIGQGRERPKTLFTWDGVGNLLSTTDVVSETQSRTTLQEYDYLNRLVRTIEPAPSSGEPQAVTLRAYDRVGNQTSVTYTSTAVNAVRKTTRFVFDRLNRLVRTILPHPQTGADTGGPVTSRTLDLVGRLISETDPSGRTTTYAYDELDRLVRRTGSDPDGIAGGTTADQIPAETRYVFDAAGNTSAVLTRRQPSTVASPLSAAAAFTVTRSRYDLLDRLVATIDANDGVIQYEYDQNGNRIRLTDTTFNTTRWQFDGQNQVIAESDPWNLSTVSEFDINGNLISLTDRRGLRRQFLRDDLNRTTRELWLSAPFGAITLTAQIDVLYDEYGRQAQTQQWDAVTNQMVSVTAVTYDNRDRELTTERRETPGLQASRIDSQYDSFDNRTVRTQQTGTDTDLLWVTTAYENYDFLNRVTRMSQTASTGGSPLLPVWQDKSVVLEYQPDSSLQAVTRYAAASALNPEVRTAYTQDGAGRLRSLTHVRPAAPSVPIARYDYQYFADGQLLREVSSVDASTTYDYDRVGQLTSSSRSQGPSESWVYDSAGNRILPATVVGKANRIESDGIYAYEHDDAGNLTRRTTLVEGEATGPFVLYSWDHRNQLIRVSFYNTAAAGSPSLLRQIEFRYDENGHRISKRMTGPGLTPHEEFYLNDGDQLIAVLAADGSIRHQYFDGPALDQVFADQTQLQGVLWPLTDHAGSVRDVINTGGSSLDHRRLSGFGSILERSGPTVDHDHFFSGLWWDADAELYYARARWYDPGAGRFLAEDPLRFAGGDYNLSRYALNDPVNRVDRNGLFSLRHAVNRIGNAFEDVGDFAEEQWDKGNIQKALLAAGVVVTGGAFLPVAGAFASGSIAAGAAAHASYSTVAFASASVNAWQGFSGDVIGDGTFGRVLSATAAVTGGFYGSGFSTSALGRSLSLADGLISGYEIGTGDRVGDGTLSGILHVGNLGVNRGGSLFDSDAGFATRVSVGLNLTTGVASLAETRDQRRQQALRSLSIASALWNTGTQIYRGSQQLLETIQQTRSEPSQIQRTSGKQGAPGSRKIQLLGFSDESEADGRPMSPDDELTARILKRLSRGDRGVYAFLMKHDVRFGIRSDINASEIEHGLRDSSGRFHRSVHPEGTSEYEVLIWTQRHIRSLPVFRQFEAKHKDEIYGPNPGAIRPQPGTPEAEMERQMAREQYYIWMNEMGATESEMFTAKAEEFFTNMFIPGGWFETAIMAVSPLGAFKGARIQANAQRPPLPLNNRPPTRLAPSSTPRQTSPMSPSKHATPNNLGTGTQGHNHQSTFSPPVKYDPQFAAQQIVQNGRVNIKHLKLLVPEGVPDTFKPSASIAAGSKFQYTVNGTKVEIKWHSPDATAASKYPNSNSGSGWTAQIKIGNRLLGTDNQFQKKPQNETHIPVDF
jgi:RHS repeat-associated protein